MFPKHKEKHLSMPKLYTYKAPAILYLGKDTSSPLGLTITFYLIRVRRLMHFDVQMLTRNSFYLIIIV